MAQGHHSSHHRRSPSGSNAAKVKPARPALHRKGTSSVNHSISKLGAAPVKQTTVDHTDDEEFEMAASFLNFWYVSGFLLVILIRVACGHPCMDGSLSNAR